MIDSAISTAVIGRSRGNTMEMYLGTVPAPSMLAAPRSSDGTSCMAARYTIIATPTFFHTVIATTAYSAVFESPSQAWAKNGNPIARKNAENGSTVGASSMLHSSAATAVGTTTGTKYTVRKNTAPRMRVFSNAARKKPNTTSRTVYATMNRMLWLNAAVYALSWAILTKFCKP